METGRTLRLNAKITWWSGAEKLVGDEDGATKEDPTEYQQAREMTPASAE